MPPAQIPLRLKLLYTAFVAVTVPAYWRHWGPQNFLYFCDVALLVTLIGIWRENALLISMQALAILLPQIYWLIDFTAQLVGLHFLRMTAYMFNPSSPLFLRGLSLFHGWLPILLLWLVHRLGYDRRALVIQTIAGVSLILICYFCFVPPGTVGSWRMPKNLNYVFGTSDTAPQTIMPPLLWLTILIIGIPTLIYWPTHLLLGRTCPKSPGNPRHSSVRNNTD